MFSLRLKYGLDLISSIFIVPIRVNSTTKNGIHFARAPFLIK